MTIDVRTRPRFYRVALVSTPLWLLACAAAHTAPLRMLQASPEEQGKSLYQQGRYAEAETTLRQATGGEAQSYLAASVVKQQKYAEAEGIASMALEAEPGNAMAVAALGEALVGQEKFQDAVDRLTKTIEAKPEMAYAYFWRAQAYGGLRQSARKIEDFQTFLKLAPDAPEAPTVRAILEGLM